MSRRANGGSGGGKVSSRDFAQALLNPSLTTTVTGTFVDVTGAPVTSGQVRFELKPSIATIIQNQNVVEPSVVYGSISPTGQLMNQAGTGPCVVVQNTVLEPGGTYYEVSIWPEFIKVAVYSWFATQATQDLSATIPLPPVLPFIPTAITGGLIRVLVITATGTQPPGVSGSAPGPYTYTPTGNTRVLYVECVGGGGAGGSAPTSATGQVSAGAGGGGGGYAAVFLSSPKASYPVTVGLGGVATLSAAPAGGSTTFDSPSVCTGFGGGSPSVGTFSAGTVIYGGGLGGGATGNGANVGDFTAAGGPGGFMVLLGGAGAAMGGVGGASGFGGGAGWPAGAYSSAAGQPGQPGGSPGGGGGGAATYVHAAYVGGNGGNGLVRVWEFA